MAENKTSCLYLKRLDDVDRDVLKELVTRSVSHLRGS
jgi:rubrerythrin